MTYRLIAAAAGLILTGGLLTGIPLRAEVIEQVLVKVNGEIVSKSDFEQRLTSSLARPEYANAKTDFELQKAIGELTPDLILEAVDELLLIQRGRELNYSLSDAQFKEILENIKKQNNLTEEAQFQAALKQEGMTLPELHKAMERQMLIARVTQNEVMSKVGITEEEARKYHSEHLQDFTKPGTVTIREILVKVPLENGAINVAADQAARQKADDIRKRALAGESFDQLASEVSDSPSKANGGLIGPLNMNELTPAFKKLVDPMKVGDVSDVLPGQGGYQIIKIESRTADEVMTPEAAHDKISDALYEEKRQVYIRRYLNKLRSQATIEWKNDEIRKAFETWAAAQPALPPDPNAAPDLPTTAKPGSSKPIPKGSPTPEKEPKPSND